MMLGLDAIAQGYLSGRMKRDVALTHAAQILNSGSDVCIKEFFDMGSRSQDVRAQSLIVDALVGFAGRGSKESKSLIIFLEKTQLTNKDFKWLMVQGLGRINSTDALPYLEKLAKESNEDYLVRFWANVALTNRA